MRHRRRGLSLGRLESRELTYPEHGATLAALPPGYRHINRRQIIGSGAAAFSRAAAALAEWRMHREAGLVVHSYHPTATTGAVLLISYGCRGARLLTAPCRVVYTIDEASRRGFAYGTLPGHPERGEEAFLVSLTSDGMVELSIRAFSRPASLLARVGGPLSRRVQDRITDRYVEALR